MNYFYSAPTYNIDTSKWSVTVFDTRKLAIEYLDSKFKYPGEYNIKDSHGVWNEQAIYFQKNKFYPVFNRGTKSYEEHWNFEKAKCQFDGFVIYKSDMYGYEFPVPSLYYFYLNYCPIVDKLKAKTDFPEIYDGDYHYYLYLLRAVLKRKYVAVLKKRQCFLSDTVIYTPKGFFKISDLETSKYTGTVYTYNTEGSKIVVDEVLEVIKTKKVKRYIQLRTVGGNFLECSTDHKIYTQGRGWVEAKNLNTSDVLVQFKQPFGDVEISQEEAKVIGYFVADGSFPNKKVCPKFTNITQKYLDDFEQSLLSFFPQASISKVVKGNGYDYKITNIYKSQGKPNPFKNWLIIGGFCGKKKDRGLPQKYLNLTRPLTSIFLSRLFAADGWVHKIKTAPDSVRYEIGIASESAPFIQQIQSLLNKYEISSSINKENPNFYKLRIFKSECTNKFLSEIGIYGKTENLQLSKISVNKKIVSFERVKTIKTIKKAEQLYDIKTKKYNSFFANGLYVHNSGYSLKNMSIILNSVWFGEAVTSKIFSNDESKVKDSWGFMEIYRDHINATCGWKRGFDPNKKLDWQIRRKANDGSYKGNLSAVKGFTTKIDPTNGVGGSAKVVFGEESGINASLAITHEYITSNVALGGMVTGLIIYSGAVGELDKAEALRKFLFFPSEYDFLPCANNIDDDATLGPEVGFFAPEWWNYVSLDEETQETLKCFDVNGNTNKELALIEIHKFRKKAESKDTSSYRYYCSQRPLSITEAFAARKESLFPAKFLHRQIQRIEQKDYALEYVDLVRDEQGNIKQKTSNKLPILEYPINPKSENKEGVIVIHERPIADIKFGRTYFASIDPVNEGRTTTSDSLCTIYIYRNERRIINAGDRQEGLEETYIEPGKLVAWWTGRFDDLTKTNQRLELLIEYYKAWTLVESNIGGFIRYMIDRKKQMYLVPRNQMAFLKEIGANTSVHQEFGWKNTNTIFKDYLLNDGIEFIKEELSQVVLEDGKVVKSTYGIERIPDIMLLREMLVYTHGVNADRIVAFCALASFAKIQNANKGIEVEVRKVGGKPNNDKNKYVKDFSFFKKTQNLKDTYKVDKSYFKNIK